MNILNQETGEVSNLELQSAEVSELAKALSKAQGAMTSAQKDGNNPHFKSSYATLNSIIQAIRKPLTDNGLSVMQTMLPDNTLVTTLLHDSGQWARSYLKLNPVQNSPQGVGSALTYARRYSLAAIVGISQDDDDGEEASQRRLEVPEGVPSEKKQPIKKPVVVVESQEVQPRAWLPSKVEFFETVRNDLKITVEEAAAMLKEKPEYTPFTPAKAMEMYRFIESKIKVNGKVLPKAA